MANDAQLVEQLPQYTDRLTPAPDCRMRQTEIDGLRGWAALAVLVFHFFYETFGVMFPDVRNPVSVSINGAFAVFIFFVLSGDALSSCFFSGRGVVSVVALAVKRHSRLALPILASVLLVYILQRAGWVFSVEAGRIVGRPDWLGGFAAEAIELGDVIAYSVVGAFATQNAGDHLVPFFWTMCAELTGSIFVFAILLIWDRLRYREIYLPPLVAILIMNAPTAYLGCFLAGMLFCAARHRGLIDMVRSWRCSGWLTTLMIVAVLAWIGVNPPFVVYRPAAGAVMLVGAIYANRHAVAFFRNAASRFLGRLSFPVYLVHFSVLISLTSYLIVRGEAAGMLTEGVAIAIGLMSVVASFAVAWAFTPVEIVTQTIGRKLMTIVLSPNSRQRMMTSA